MQAKKLSIDPNTQLLLGIHYCPSTHCDERPLNTIIDMIVIHNISLPPKEFGGEFVEKFFCGDLNPTLHPYFANIANLRVSSHVYIKRNGEIIQFVPFDKRAWHAGVSSFAGKNNCNDFSIGIELEGADDVPYTIAQYQQLIQLIQRLQIHYPHITKDRIVGHADIAPERKTDPGDAFDWLYVKGKLR